jgi:hypothetical protein
MNNGGSIFPIFDVSSNEKNKNFDDPFTGGIYPTPDVGLSVRDYYAAAVLTGLFARGGLAAGDSVGRVALADKVFDMADAMLDRRKVKRYKNFAEMEADKKETE